MGVHSIHKPRTGGAVHQGAVVVKVPGTPTGIIVNYDHEHATTGDAGTAMNGRFDDPRYYTGDTSS